MLYFRRDAAGLTLTLTRLGLRVVRGREDLTDIDLAQASYTRDRSRNWYPRKRPWTREAALEAVLSDLG